MNRILDWLRQSRRWLWQSLSPMPRPGGVIRRTASGILATAVVLSASVGCASMSNKEKGVVIGAGAGAAADAGLGNATGSTARGAIILAAIGGVGGGVIGHQMDQQAKELTYELPGATVERVGEGIQVTFSEGLLFGYDSDDLSGGAQTHLKSFAKSLEKYPMTNSMIVGHTDSKGTGEYNVGLSERRAQSALTFLMAQGVSRTRLATVGRGSTEPVATNDTDRGRQLNRRVEVAIYADEAFRRQAKTGN